MGEEAVPEGPHSAKEPISQRKTYKAVDPAVEIENDIVFRTDAKGVGEQVEEIHRYGEDCRPSQKTHRFFTPS